MFTVLSRQAKRWAYRSWVDVWNKHLTTAVFVHINKTGGTSVERALGMPFQHRTAREFVEIMGKRRWDRRFTFCFVRNPWDRAVSQYAYRVATHQTQLGTGQISFKEWVKRTYVEEDPHYFDNPKMFMTQLEWIQDADGRVVVNFVGRFERLQSDFATVCNKLSRASTLPHLRRSGREGMYRQMYDCETREIIADRFQADIQTFGYAF